MNPTENNIAQDKSSQNEEIFVNVADRVKAENRSAKSDESVTAQLKGTSPYGQRKEDFTRKDSTAAANVSTEPKNDQELGFIARQIEHLRERVFRYHQKKQGPVSAIFPSYKQVKKVLILFESDILERNSQLKQLVRELQADGKQITAWGFVDKKQITSSILRDYRVLGRQDVNFFGKPKDYEIQDLRNEHFDLLISLNVNNLMPLRYLNLFADADFRVGQVNEEPFESNFMVALPEGQKNQVYLFDQLMIYLRKINAPQ